MSQRDGFSTGFLLGSLVGGLVGGTIGAVLASRQLNGEEPEVLRRIKARTQNGLPNNDLMESAQQSLENKIADLNGAIEQVRSSLNNGPLDEPPVASVGAEHQSAESLES
jgi:hypothetical protein